LARMQGVATVARDMVTTITVISVFVPATRHTAWRHSVKITKCDPQHNMILSDATEAIHLRHLYSKTTVLSCH